MSEEPKKEPKMVTISEMFQNHGKHIQNLSKELDELKEQYFKHLIEDHGYTVKIKGVDDNEERIGTDTSAVKKN